MSVAGRAALMAPVLAIIAALSAIDGDWRVAFVSLLGSALVVLIVVHLRRKAQAARRAAGVLSDLDYEGLDFP
jgi:hypothetical protein